MSEPSANALGESSLAPTAASAHRLFVAATAALTILCAWLIYGAGMAAMVTFSFVGHPQGMRLEPPGEGHYSKSELLLPRLLPPVAWFSFFVAGVVTVRLLLAGFRTAFL